MEIVLDYRPALRERTGVGEYVHHLAGALLAQLPPGDGVTLFSSSWKDRLGDPIPGASPVDQRIPVSALNLLWHRLEWPPVELLGARPDVTWSLHPMIMPSRRAARVVSIMDLHFLEAPGSLSAEIRRDYAALAPDHLRRADAIVTISAYTRRLTAERFGVPLDRIAVCHPGQPAWSPRHPPSPGGPVLHVGTLDGRKNIPALLRAYDLLVERDHDAPPLLFAGRGPGRTGEPGVQPSHGRARFLGYVSEERKLELYRAASLLVIASTDEGFGIPAVEAMTLGVPVVASNRGALPEVIGDAGLLVDPDDGPAFADAMYRVLHDSTLRAMLIARGFRQAATFRWEESARRLLQTFREAIARRATRS